MRAALQLPGVYMVAFSRASRTMDVEPNPVQHAVKYIGETGLLLRRLGQFGTSAGLFGERGRGHSAGWRWKDEWIAAGAYVALYPVPKDVADSGLSPFWRLCREAQAQAAYAQAHGQRLPELNAKGANDSIDD